MFVVLTYDVSSKKANKTIKICRKYLSHVQKSVFEGYLTGLQLEQLKNEIKPIIDPNKDSILIYCMESTKYTKKLELGKVVKDDFII